MNPNLRIKTFILNYWFLIFFVLVFLMLGSFGLDQIYHQDEYRWAAIADPVFNNFQGSHPPVTRYVLRTVGEIFGYDNLRIAPLFFAVLNLVLIYFISRQLSRNRAVALIAAGLFTVSTYSLIAALQIDIDGAILPFFVLSGYYAYLKLLNGGNNRIWLYLLFLAIIGGFFTKLSYVIFIGAAGLDYLILVFYQQNNNFPALAKKIFKVAGSLIILLAILYLFFAARLGNVISYAEHFKIFNFGSRSYFDLGFKIMKSLVWLSPLLFLPVIGGLFSREVFKRYRFWYIYLILNSLFYLVVFDFAKLTIERYLMFLIVPSCIVAAQVIYDLFNKKSIRQSQSIVVLLLATVIFTSISVLKSDHEVLPLNPKAAYVEHIKSLDFGFLIPFSGGSGPIGFYGSARFILLSWLAASLILVSAIWFKRNSRYLLWTFLFIGIGYNIFHTGEYLFGLNYGSPAKVARASVEYVNNNPSIREVITYNDIGAYELKKSGKYASRFYTAPERDYTEKLGKFRGHYLIVDFPEIDKGGRYWAILKNCEEISEFKDKRIYVFILDCFSRHLSSKVVE